MNAFQKAIIGVAIAAMVLVAWLGRYTVVIGSRGDGTPPGYVLDRWTGRATLLYGGQVMETRPVPKLE